jgi:uncharacterized protein involved in outer membrane biogenesis
LGTLVLLTVLFAVFFDWNLFRPTLARIISEKTGRHTVIRGNLRVHLWSFEPSAEIDGLTLDNPPWAQHSVMFTAEQLTLSVSLGRLLRGQLVVPQVKVVRPAVDLERDAEERASWALGTQEGRPQKSSQPAKIPTIRRLVIESGTIRVSDAIRNLRLDGTLNASDVSGRQSDGFELKCSGSLNGKPFRADLHGGALINLDPDHPYQLTAHLTAADIKVDAQTSFPKPFDTARYRVKFEVSGNDLADVFYLTGLALPNTPPYRLSGDVEHRGTLFRMDNLKGTLGASDIEGRVEVETGRTRPKLSAQVRSDTLNVVDLAPTLGHPAAPANTLSAETPPAAAKHAHRGAVPPPVQAPTPQAQPAAPASQWLFPDADLQVNRVRGMDADVTYQARAVVAPKMPMKEVKFHLLLNDGVLQLDPLSFVLDSGRFAGNVTIDAAKDVPESTIDMGIDAVDLSQFTSAQLKQPPLQGAMTGRLKIHGYGASVHKLASSADGTDERATRRAHRYRCLQGPGVAVLAKAAECRHSLRRDRLPGAERHTRCALGVHRYQQRFDHRPRPRRSGRGAARSVLARRPEESALLPVALPHHAAWHAAPPRDGRESAGPGGASGCRRSARNAAHSLRRRAGLHRSGACQE